MISDTSEERLVSLPIQTVDVEILTSNGGLVDFIPVLVTGKDGEHGRETDTSPSTSWTRGTTVRNRWSPYATQQNMRAQYAYGIRERI